MELKCIHKNFLFYFFLKNNLGEQMVKVKIICKNSYCGRKTVIIVRVNFIEESYYCPRCGYGDTEIVEMK